MDKVSVFARFVAKEDRADELVAAFDDLFAQVEKEPGTEVYVLNRSGKDPNEFFFYELYTDADALGAHGTSEVMGKAMEQLKELLASSELVFGAPVRAKGVAL